MEQYQKNMEMVPFDEGRLDDLIEGARLAELVKKADSDRNRTATEGDRVIAICPGYPTVKGYNPHEKAGRMVLVENDDYVAFVKAGAHQVDGLPVVRCLDCDLAHDYTVEDFSWE